VIQIPSKGGVKNLVGKYQCNCIALACRQCERAKKNDGGEEPGSLENFKFEGFLREGKCEAPIYGCSENPRARRTDPIDFLHFKSTYLEKARVTTVKGERYRYWVPVPLYAQFLICKN
jgi:hypothetical protein